MTVDGFTQMHITKLHYLEQDITYNTNTTQNTTITVPRIYTKTVTIVIKLLGTFLVILTLTIWEDVTTLSPFFKAAVSFTINISFGTTLASIGLLSAVRMLDIHIKFVHFKFYPWTFQEVPKTTPASKLAVKAATVPETPVRDSKPSPKKTVTPKKDKKKLVRKVQPKEHQRCQNQRKWLKFHPHWKRKNLVSVVLWQEMVLGCLVQRKSLR